MSARIAFNGLDPARTALLVVHMVKGVAGEVVTPFSQLFRQRAEQTGIIKAQLRLLDAFRGAKAKVLYTAVTYQTGLPGVSPNSPLWRILFDCVCLMEGTPAVELLDQTVEPPASARAVLPPSAGRPNSLCGPTRSSGCRYHSRPGSLCRDINRYQVREFAPSRV